MAYTHWNGCWRGGTVLAIVACLAAGAQAGLVGNRFAISDGNSQVLPENQPQVVYGNGQYLVVYTHWTPDSLDQVSGDIYGAFVNPQTNHVNTFPVDDYDSSSTSPAVAYDPDNDRYLLAYVDQRSAYADTDLYIRMLDATGQTLAEQFIASSWNYELMPDVVYVGGGKFLVVWCSTTDPDLPTAAVIAARSVSYIDSEFIFGTEQLANAGTPFVGLTHPKAAVDKFGQCLLVWQWPFSTAGSTVDDWVHVVQGRVLNSDGLPIGPVASLATSPGSQTMPSIAYDPYDDLFCVAWQDLTSVGDHDILGTLARITAGQVTPTTLLAMATVTNNDTKPAVCWNGDKHEFQVLWEAEYTPQDHDIYACSISPAGTVNPEFVVVESMDMEANPALARGNDQFLAVWEDELAGVEPVNVYGAVLYDLSPPPHVTGVWPPLRSVQSKALSPSEILVEFDQPMQISLADLTVLGLQTGVRNDFTLSYDPVGYFATLSWAGPLADDTYLVTVKDTALSSSGLKLDGEMNLLSPAFPSGNGIEGGQFQGLLYRLVGDGNGDRSVNTVDLLSLAVTWGLNPASPGFDPRFDFNDDSAANVVDLLFLADHWGKTIPVGP